MAADLKQLHLPAHLVRGADELWPRLRELPEVRALAPRETPAGAVRVLVWLAEQHFDQLLALANSCPAKPGP